MDISDEAREEKKLFNGMLRKDVFVGLKELILPYAPYDSRDVKSPPQQDNMDWEMRKRGIKKYPFLKEKGVELRVLKAGETGE